MHRAFINCISEDILIQEWDKEKPLISIVCVTYNHGLYINDAINGFLAQKSKYPFEIVIYDDASTDDTQQIISNYYNQYPKLIKPIIQQENQWLGKGINGTLMFAYPAAKGKYIALCEGDDYWTDPLKLQKQVDFLEANADYSGSVHSVDEINETNEKRSKSHIINKYTFELEDIIHSGRVGETCSVLFRREILDSWLFQFNKIMSGDLLVMLAIGYHGKIQGLNETMGVYRKQNNGMSASMGFLNNFIPQYIELLRFFDRKTNFKHWKIIRARKLHLLKEQVKFSSSRKERINYFLRALIKESYFVINSYYRLLKKL
jgi:glycosyltransferase involved in cell wall biosynthesis